MVSRCVWLLSFLGFLSSIAQAQVPEVTHWTCIDPRTDREIPCQGNSSGSGSSSSSGGYSGFYVLGQALRQLLSGGLSNRATSAGKDPALERAYRLNELGNKAYESKDWNTALKHYTEALQNSPDDKVIRANLGHAQNQIGIELYNGLRSKEALPYFKAAHENDPNSTVLKKNFETTQQEVQQQEENAARAARFRQQLGSVSDKLSSIQPDISGLDFDNGQGNAGIQGLPGVYIGGAHETSARNSDVATPTNQQQASPGTEPVSKDTGKGAEAGNSSPHPDIPGVPGINQQNVGTKAEALDFQSSPVADPQSDGAAKSKLEGAKTENLPQNSGAQSQLLSIDKSSRAAVAEASGPEAASEKARVGFDQPSSLPPPVQVQQPVPHVPAAPTTGETNGVHPAHGAPVPSPDVSQNAIQAPNAKDLDLLFQDGEKSRWPGPKNPGLPLMNPVWEEEKLVRQLKSWDDWATKTALQDTNLSGPPQLGESELDRQIVQQYAPQLLGRFEQDKQFHADTVLRIKVATEQARLEYYQQIADAHKTALLRYRAEIQTLEDKGVLEKGMGLEDQVQRHPERREIIDATYKRVHADEDVAVDKAKASGSVILDKEYRTLFAIVVEQAEH